MSKKIKKLIGEVSVSTIGDEASYFTGLANLIDDFGVLNLLGHKFYITNHGISFMGKEFKYCTLTDEELSEKSYDKKKSWICLKMGEGINLMCSDWDTQLLNCVRGVE